MDRGDILSGAAFTAVLRSAVVFVFVLILTTILSINLLDRALTEQVEMRVLEMAETLGETAYGDGVEGLADRIESLTQNAAGQTLAYALFNPDGTRITGNTDVRPAQGEWLMRSLTLTPQGQSTTQTPPQVFLLHAIPLGDLTLVVGRNAAFVAEARSIALRGFALTGFIVVLTMLGIGYALSRRSQEALQKMEATLDAISRGETRTRIPIPDQPLTQIDRIARRVNAHLDQLEALFAQTQRTAASVAHDLRRPLARATLGMERALARLEAGEDARDEVEQALTDLARLKEIIAAILRIARIESGEVGGISRIIDLRGLLDEVVETFAPVAEDSGQRLDYQRPDAALPLRGDPGMVGQLVVNLIQNAIAHAGPGATIRLAAHRDRHALLLTVADDGPGIPDDLRTKVFEPFFRADPSRTIEGSGLGLPLVKAIVHRHGAEITLADAAPGLLVQVRFPA